MHLDPGVLLRGVWLAVGLVWLVGAFKSKASLRAQSKASRLAHLALQALGFCLLFWGRLGMGFLARRFVPESVPLAYSGLAITVVGAAFTIYARVLLGANWSATVTIKQDHALVQTGPYRIVRHPIYSGLLLTLAGTALVAAQIRALAALVVLFIAFRMKYRMEEAFLVEEFGDEYLRYRRKVKALIPFLI